jgi:hypothetical protein
MSRVGSCLAICTSVGDLAIGLATTLATPRSSVQHSTGSRSTPPVAVTVVAVTVAALSKTRSGRGADGHRVDSPLIPAAAGRSSTCYRNSLRIAAGLGAHRVAFPAISTGIYRWPVEAAATIALTAVTATSTDTPGITTVRFVLFDQRTLEAFEAAASAL